MTDLVRQKLQALISQFGVAVCNDVKRCEALLKDLCPQNKREVRLLVIALGDGAVKKLSQPSSLMTTENLIAQLVQSLDENWGIASHHAQWTVESWALVLGIQFKSGAIADKEKVGTGLPKSTVQTNTPQPKAVQPTVDHVAAFEQLKQQKALAEQQKIQTKAQIEVQKDWQKIGQQGELLTFDAPHWAAAIDKKTQLMWAINPSKTANFPNPSERMNWDDAMAWAEYVNTQGWCGFNDWRLPTIDELKTLLTKDKQPTLHLNQVIFNDIEDYDDDMIYHYVWSSSPVAHGSSSAWIVPFNNGLDYSNNKYYYYYVRLVRSS